MNQLILILIGYVQNSREVIYMYSFDAETFKKLLDMMMKCQKFHPILMRDYNDMFYKDFIKHTISRKKLFYFTENYILCGFWMFVIISPFRPWR